MPNIRLKSVVRLKKSHVWQNVLYLHWLKDNQRKLKKLFKKHYTNNEDVN